MIIKKRKGIREVERKNKIMLFNTYTYEKIQLIGKAADTWKNLSFDSYIYITLSNDIESLVLDLISKKYIEVL